MTTIRFAAGLAALIAGAELLVRGASRIAAGLGLSPLVIGLTIVAFGTSSPELAVSLGAALSGDADLAVGNVVGSNVFNVLFILGVCALIAPLQVSRQLVRLDVPIMIGVSVLLLVMALDAHLGVFDGLTLLAGLAAYTVFAIREGLAEGATGDGAPALGPSALLANGALAAGGVAILVLGARWLVASATSLAQWLGVSDLVIGLTVVAAGTSLPEVATSVVAAMRGERDIAVGNVVGSNVLNILGILGATALVSGGLDVAPAVRGFDLPVMLAASVACLPIFLTGHEIARWEGALFLGYYVAYTSYLVLASLEHDALAGLSRAMAAFVLPLTTATLLVVAVRALGQRARDSAAKRDRTP